MKRFLLLSLALLGANTLRAQNSVSGSLGTLTVGPWPSTSTSTAYGAVSAATSLPVTCEYLNPTPVAQDSLSISVVQLLGPGAVRTVSKDFSRAEALAAYTTRTFAIGTLPHLPAGTYSFQATVSAYNRRDGFWTTNASRQYWLYLAQPLAVELVSFRYQVQPAGTGLKWHTASEKDNDHFEVERSLDGTDYVKIGTVAGHGTTSQAQQYAWLDAGAPGPVGYYRLRQVDIDGTAAYSPVLVVLARPSSAVQLWPNPAHDVLQVRGASELTIYSLAGVLLRRQEVPPDGRVPLDLPPGSYLVRAGQQHQRLTVR